MPQTDGQHAQTIDAPNANYQRNWRVEFVHPDGTWKTIIYDQHGGKVADVDSQNAQLTGPNSGWYSKPINFVQNGSVFVTAWFQQGNTWYQLLHYAKDTPICDKFSVTGDGNIMVTVFDT